MRGIAVHRAFVGWMAVMLGALALAGCGGGSTTSGPLADVQTAGGDGGQGGFEPIFMLSGVAYLSSPIRGGEVKLYPLNADLEPRDILSPIAETTTNDRGEFELNWQGALEPGTYVIEVSGEHAVYHSAVTGLDELLDAPVAVRAPLFVEQGVGVGIVPMQIDMWRSLIFELARALVWNGTYPNIAAAWPDAERRMRRHIFREPGDDPNAPPPQELSWLLAIPAHLPGDPAFDPTTPEGELGLVQWGLSHLTSNFEEGFEPRKPGEHVTEADVLYALQRDLADGMFDGMGPYALDRYSDRTAVYVKGDVVLPLEATRRDLAWSIWNAMAQDQAVRDVISKPGGLLDRLATDDGPLYPPSAPPPSVFDPNGPQTSWIDPTPPEQAFVRETLVARVRAQDESGIARIEPVSPPGLLVGTLEPQDGGSVEATVTLPLDGVPDGVLTVTVRAVDGQEQVTELSRTFEVDQTPVHVEAHFEGVQSVDAAAQWATAQSFVVVAGTAVDPEPTEGLASGVDWVRVRVGDSEPLPAQVDSDGAWSVQVPLPQGVSVVVVEARDVAGNETYPLQMGSVMRDATPPELQVDEPPEGSWVGTTTPMVSGTVFDLGVGGVTVVVRNPDTGGEKAAQVDPTTGSFSVQSPPLVLEASNVIEVVATDAVGNAATVERTVGVDQEPPEVTVTEHSKWGQPGASVSLSGSADDGQGSGAASVSVCEAGATDSCWSGSVDPTGKWSAKVKAPASEGAPANYVVRVFDKAGNEGDADATVHADATPPTLTADATGTVWTSTDQATVTGTASDGEGSGVATVDSTGLPPNVSGVSMELSEPDAGGTISWTATVELTGDGVAWLEFEATDYVGNVSASPVSVQVGRDTAPPTLEVTAPANGQWVGTAMPVVEGVVHDAGSQDVTVVATNPASGQTTQVEGLADGASFTLTAPVGPSVGVYNVALTAADGAGNTSQPVVVSVQVDTMAPSVTVDPFVWGKAGSTVTLSATASDGSGAGVSQVEMCPDPAQPGDASCVPATYDQVENTWNAAVPVPGAEGQTVTWKVYATDKVGNVGSGATTVKADAKPPTVTVNGVEPGGTVWTNQSQYGFGGAVDDGAGSGVAAVSVTVDGQTLPPVALGPSPSGGMAWQIPAFNLQPGVHAIELTAVDKVGNTSPVFTFHVVVDATAPVLGTADSPPYADWLTFAYHDTSATPGEHVVEFEPKLGASPFTLAQCLGGNSADTCEVRLPLHVAAQTLADDATAADVEASGLPALGVSVVDEGVNSAKQVGLDASVDVTCIWSATDPDKGTTLTGPTKRPAIPVNATTWYCVLDRQALAWPADYTPPGSGKVTVHLDVVAKDPAGNQEQMAKTFDVRFIAPLPTITWHWLDEPKVGNTVATLSPIPMLHTMFQDSSSTQLIEMQVHNPYPFPLEDLTLNANPTRRTVRVRIQGTRYVGDAVQSCGHNIDLCFIPGSSCPPDDGACLSEPPLDCLDCDGYPCKVCQFDFTPVPGEVDTGGQSLAWWDASTCQDVAPHLAFEQTFTLLSGFVSWGTCPDGSSAGVDVEPPSVPNAPWTIATLPPGASACGAYEVPLSEELPCLLKQPATLEGFALSDAAGSSVWAFYTATFDESSPSCTAALPEEAVGHIRCRVKTCSTLLGMCQGLTHYTGYEEYLFAPLVDQLDIALDELDPPPQAYIELWPTVLAPGASTWKSVPAASNNAVGWSLHLRGQATWKMPWAGAFATDPFDK